MSKLAPKNMTYSSFDIMIMELGKNMPTPSPTPNPPGSPGATDKSTTQPTVISASYSITEITESLLEIKRTKPNIKQYMSDNSSYAHKILNSVKIDFYRYADIFCGSVTNPLSKDKKYLLFYIKKTLTTPWKPKT